MIPGIGGTASSAAGTDESPFTQADVELTEDGAYDITWTSAAETVTVTASPNPDGSDSTTPVGAGSGSGSLTVTMLEPDWYFVLTTDTGERLVTRDQSLHMSNARNLRDLGGYRTADGRWTRPGLVFRSNRPTDLDAADWQRLASLNIADLADLRNTQEVEEDPYTPPNSMTYTHLDVMNVAGNPDLTKCGLTIPVGLLEVLATTSDIEDAGTAMGYPLSTCAGSANDAFGTLMDMIESTDRSLLFHCSGGKDRTGWASAILLTILGVSRETVIADFLDSNRYRGPGSVQREWIESAFAQVDRSYGDFDTYVHDGLGLSTAQVASLRDRLLQDTAPAVVGPNVPETVNPTEQTPDASVPAVGAPSVGSNSLVGSGGGDIEQAGQHLPATGSHARAFLLTVAAVLLAAGLTTRLKHS
ncbi:MAG: tyrosine-protein phosphatase [Aeromicrobium sp.]|uniref:tyrosine-protein phosphatase n=1 Tax=Aeromicrobium sp. TaxID=1871063 RepID=UPI0039E4D09B